MHQEFINFEKILSEQERVPIFLNDLDIITTEGKHAFGKTLMTLYEEESLTTAPMCQCRHLRGGKYHKDICPVCNTACEYELEKDIYNELWLRTPEGIDTFINPAFYIVLEHMLTKSKVNLLDYLINPLMKNPGNAEWLDEVDRRNIPRGLNNFYRNFDAIMEEVFQIVKSNRAKDIGVMRELIKSKRDLIFTKYLNVPNRMAFVIESNDYNRWADKTIEAGMNAVITIVSADTVVHGRKKSIARKEAMVATAMKELASFWNVFWDKVAGKKPGYFRQEIFGQRSHFTFRGVITSITNAHRYDEVHLPWKMGVQLLKDHIISKLLRGKEGKYRAHSPKEAEYLVGLAVNKHIPLIADIMNELIEECPTGKGIPIILQRNPSLKRGSAKFLYITLIKDDVNNFTISLSTLILSSYNADFDGDELNGYLIIDMFLATILERLHPCYTVMDLNMANEVSGDLAIPKPLTSTIDNWIYDEEYRLSLLDGE